MCFGPIPLAAIPAPPPTRPVYSEVKDSGKRQEFTTGSKRDTQDGKGRFVLISPIVAERDARHLENGAKKYGDRNWELGQPLSRFMDSAMRHMNKFLEGHRDEDHLAAARWNLGAIIHIEEMIRRGRLPKTLSDLPDYTGDKTTPAGPSQRVTATESLQILNAERERLGRIVADEADRGVKRILFKTCCGKPGECNC